MVRLGYHPATYVRQDIEAEEALKDISSTGWDGFEWSPGRLDEAYAQPEEYRRYLQGLDLEISGLYCPCSFLDDESIAAWQETIGRTIEFATAIGTEYIMLDGGSTHLPRNGQTIHRIARLANEVGKRILDAGLICTWHQHWGSIFEYTAEFDALMAATDPQIVKCTPDTAQLALGDFDIPATFEKYIERMHYVHFKDLDENRRFIELGRGIVDFPPLAEMLKQAGFDGWIVVDLDYTSLDPRESSRHNLSYLRETLGFEGRRAVP